MERRDYVLREIAMLAAVTRRVLVLLGVRRYDEAMREVEGSARRMGFDLGLMRRLAPESLRAVLTHDGRLDAARAVALGELLRLEGDVHRLRLQPTEWRVSHARALGLLVEACLADPALRTPDRAAAVDALAAEFGAADLPRETVLLAAAYYEAAGRFAAAEDLLFELADLGAPGVLAAGEAFYERLSRRGDAELEEGGLSRDEVRDGPADLRRACVRAAADGGAP